MKNVTLVDITLVFIDRWVFDASSSDRETDEFSTRKQSILSPGNLASLSSLKKKKKFQTSLLNKKGARIGLWVRHLIYSFFNNNVLQKT